jgi:hypothetical protein
MRTARNWIGGVAFSFALLIGGTVAAQERVPPLPYDSGADGSSQNWREQIEAEREAKGLSGPRNRTSNWADRYGYGQRQYDDSQWDRFRSPRIGPNRPEQNRQAQRLQAMETQAETYQRLYWMMRAQIEAEQANR